MSQVPVSESVYYKDVYWNDHAKTQEYFARIILNGRNSNPEWWPKHFLKYFVNGKAFSRALIINCGNGWVERQLYDLGIFKSAVAFDYSEELLNQAKKAADLRAIEYIQADCNKVEFEEDSFDLIVNVAAMHHVQLIDRMHRLLAKALRPEGYFLNFDYVGPHRNQYGKEHFEIIKTVNNLLPLGFANKNLFHPHLETMLHVDPTEAIHSELTMECFNRYFSTEERLDLNGAIAYQIMYNNQALYQENLPSANKAVQFLLEMDELYTHYYNLPALFSYYVGRPKKQVLKDKLLLETYTKEEKMREEFAALNGGKYDYKIELP